MIAQCTFRQLEEFLKESMGDDFYVYVFNNSYFDLITDDASEIVDRIQVYFSYDYDSIYVILDDDDYIEAVESLDCFASNFNEKYEEFLRNQVKVISSSSELSEYRVEYGNGVEDFMYISYTPYMGDAFTVLLKEVRINEKGERYLSS